MAESAATIEVGQCFTKADATYADVWQVVALMEPRGGPTHARLVRLSHPDDCKTLSVVVLNDPRHFHIHEAGKVVRRRLRAVPASRAPGAGPQFRDAGDQRMPGRAAPSRV